MNKNNTTILFNEFPNLYADRNKGYDKTQMQSFAVDDGWFDIIYSLSQKLEHEIIKYKRDNPNASADDIPRAFQVKEKFGGLRFYMDGKSTKEMNEAISEAEQKADKTCERCSSGGQIVKNGRGWVKTLCSNCHNKWRQI